MKQAPQQDWPFPSVRYDYVAAGVGLRQREIVADPVEVDILKTFFRMKDPLK
jgi:hypothetical protein